MAGKKPSKVNYGNKTKEAERPGKATMYMAGDKNSFNKCPKCGKKTGKGILYDYQNALYCSRYCIPKIDVVL